MTDSYPLIARRVAALEQNTAETRRALYQRAQSALLGQLRELDPPLAEPDIARERQSLRAAPAFGPHPRRVLPEGVQHVVVVERTFVARATARSGLAIDLDPRPVVPRDLDDLDGGAGGPGSRGGHLLRGGVFLRYGVGGVGQPQRDARYGPGIGGSGSRFSHAHHRSSRRGADDLPQATAGTSRRLFRGSSFNAVALDLTVSAFSKHAYR